MKYEGLRNLLYFAYGSLLKGYCGKHGEEYAEKVRRYLEGEISLEQEILNEANKQLPNAMLRLGLLASDNDNMLFSLENVNKYIFKVHNQDNVPECMVMNGILKKVYKEKNTLEVEKEGKIVEVKYLPSLEKTLKLEGEVHFHFGWLIPNE